MYKTPAARPFVQQIARRGAMRTGPIESLAEILSHPVRRKYRLNRKDRVAVLICNLHGLQFCNCSAVEDFT